jgi:hypothetical protein
MKGEAIMNVNQLDFAHYIQLMSDEIKNDIYSNISNETLQDELFSYIDNASSIVLETFETELSNGSLQKK